ncbi:MAG: TerB family tellurite resistance protein [Sphaerochaetaceae bacterium]
MAWLGKLFGGTLGFMFGGPLGMIAGIAFGHMFDKADALGKRQTPYEGSSDSSQMMFFVGAFSMIARIAQADGQVTQSERDAINNFIRTKLNLGVQEQAAAMRVFDAALQGGGTFEQFASQFYENFSSSPALLQLMIEFFYQVSAADGRVNIEEEAMIRQAVNIFRIPSYVVDAICKKYGCSSRSDHAYAVLNLEPNATDEEVKRSYRKMSIEFHPDTLASKGLGTEFKAAAEAKFREIQEAYEEIKKERGIK